MKVRAIRFKRSCTTFIWPKNINLVFVSSFLSVVKYVATDSFNITNVETKPKKSVIYLYAVHISDWKGGNFLTDKSELCRLIKHFIIYVINQLEGFSVHSTNQYILDFFILRRKTIDHFSNAFHSFGNIRKKSFLNCVWHDMQKMTICIQTDSDQLLEKKTTYAS